jgi:hypothetical protein
MRCGLILMLMIIRLVRQRFKDQLPVPEDIFEAFFYAMNSLVVVLKGQ